MSELPDLSSPYRVPAERVREFREKGHTCLRGLASRAEVEALRPAIERCAAERALDRRPLAERDTYGRAFLQSINLWLVDRAVRQFVLAPRFAAAAAVLLGVGSVRLYHDQALCKEPGGGATPWHQDQFYWPLATDRTITLWMPLVDLEPRVGSMTFASGSQRLGHLGEHAIGDQSQRVFEALVTEHGLARETHGALAAGDATFHAGWTLHSAGPNPGDRLRSVMTVIYYEDGARTAPLDHPMRRLDGAVYLPGCAEGEPAASPFTPRLHPPERAADEDPPRYTAAQGRAIARALREAGRG